MAEPLWVMRQTFGWGVTYAWNNWKNPMMVYFVSPLTITKANGNMFQFTSGSRVHWCIFYFWVTYTTSQTTVGSQVFLHASIVFLTMESVLIKKISMDGCYFYNVWHGTTSHAFLLHFSHLVMLMLLMALIFH